MPDTTKRPPRDDADRRAAPVAGALASVLDELARVVRDDPGVRRALGRLIDSLSPDALDRPASPGEADDHSTRDPDGPDGPPPSSASSVTAETPSSPPRVRTETMQIGGNAVEVEVLADDRVPGPKPITGPTIVRRDPPPQREREPWWASGPLADLAACARTAGTLARRLGAAADALEGRPAGDADASTIARDLRDDPFAGDWTRAGALEAQRPDPALLRDAAVAASILARAADVVARLEASGPKQHDLRPESWQMLASAQYLLRERLTAAGIEDDPLQRAVFAWLRRRADEERQFIERHLKELEPDGPPEVEDLVDAADDLDARLVFRTTTLRTRTKKLHNLTYKCRRLAEDKADAGETAAEWRRIADLAQAVVDTGVPPTLREMRDAVLDALDTLSADVEATLDGPIRATIASARALAARRREGDVATEDGAPSADADAPPTARAAIDDVLARHPGRIVLALNGRSDPDYRYERPAEVREAFEWLAVDYHDARTGAVPCNHLELDLRLRDRCGWQYRAAQSATTVGRFPEWYRCTYEGRSFDVHEHIGRGDARRLGSKSIRVAFAWDDERQVVVVGFLGQHQRTTAS